MSKHNRELACHYVGRLTGLAAIEKALDEAEARGRKAQREQDVAALRDSAAAYENCIRGTNGTGSFVSHEEWATWLENQKE